MVGLVIFGWVCLVLITSYITLATLTGAYISMAFSGKIEMGLVIPLFIAIALWVLVVRSAPFQIVTQ